MLLLLNVSSKLINSNNMKFIGNILAAVASAAFFLSPAFAADSSAEGLFPLTKDSLRRDGVAYGEWISAEFESPKAYPGTVREVSVYVPAEYDGKTPACVAVFAGAPSMNCGEVVSNLIADKKIPVMIAVFVGPGTLRGNVSNLSKVDNSACENLMPSPRYADFITGEILPFVETLSAGNSRRIALSKKPADRMIGGVGAGANAAFWAAWRRPGEFSRVFAGFGAESAGLACHGEVEITEPREMRAFFSGVRCATVEAVGASGCGMEFKNCGERHVRAQADMVFPEAMEFLWRGWPELPAPARESENAGLKSLLMPDSPFAPVRAFGGADAILPDSSGGVVCSSETSRLLSMRGLNTVGIFPGRIIASGKKFLISRRDGSLVLMQGGERSVVDRKISPSAACASRSGGFFVIGGDPGGGDKKRIFHVDLFGRVKCAGESPVEAGAVAESADGNWLYVFGPSSNFGYCMGIGRDGTLSPGQEFFFLPGYPAPSVSCALADAYGRVYAASEDGIRVYGPGGGRALAVLSLPGGRRPVSLAWGGADGNILYVLCSDAEGFSRRLKTEFAGVSAPAPRILSAPR